MARAIANEVRDVFKTVGLGCTMDESDTPQNACQKYRYYSYQRTYNNSSLSGEHTFLKLAMTMLQHLWRSKRVHPRYEGPIAQDGQLMACLCLPQDMDWVGRRVMVEKTVVHLNTLYCVDGRATQKKLAKQMQTMTNRWTRLCHLTQISGINADFIQQILPDNLYLFTRQLKDEQQKTKAILMDMVRELFTRSVCLMGDPCTKAKKREQMMAEVLRMAGRSLPRLIEHQSLHAGKEHSLCVEEEAMVFSMGKLPHAFAIPELCALIFRSRRLEFFREVCQSVQCLDKENPRFVDCYDSTLLNKTQPEQGRKYFQSVVGSLFYLLGRLSTDNILEVLCASVLLLEPAFNLTEQEEIYNILKSYVSMLLDIQSALEELNDAPPSCVDTELKALNKKIHDLVFGEDIEEVLLPKPDPDPLTAPDDSCTLY